jgi:hypothetical protein
MDSNVRRNEFVSDLALKMEAIFPSQTLLPSRSYTTARVSCSLNCLVVKVACITRNVLKGAHVRNELCVETSKAFY